MLICTHSFHTCFGKFFDHSNFVSKFPRLVVVRLLKQYSISRSALWHSEIQVVEADLADLVDEEGEEDEEASVVRREAVEVEDVVVPPGEEAFSNEAATEDEAEDEAEEEVIGAVAEDEEGAGAVQEVAQMLSWKTTDTLASSLPRARRACW